MKLIKAIIAVFFATLCCPEYCYGGAVQVQIPREAGLADELPTIITAAERNGCWGNDFVILLAIRKAENGGPGREFGVLHPKCLAQIQVRPEDSLDIQAGWAAATIVKNRKRWKELGFCKYISFIDFLGNRYCPYETDPEGNINWKRNVKFWFKKLKSGQGPQDAETG